MSKLDFPAAGESFAGAAADTDELAWELQQPRPDTHRIKWLVEDMRADVSTALARANIDESALTKNPLLRPLGLQKHLHR